MAYDHAARIAQAKKKLETAASLLSKDDEAEIEGRAEEAKLLADAREAEAKARELDLVRREDAARVVRPRVRGVAVKGRDDTFVVCDPGPASYDAYQTALTKAIQDGKSTKDAQHEFAKASVVDFNGMTDWNALDKEMRVAGDMLTQYLKANPAVVSLLANAAAELAGFAAEERKSAG